MGAIRVRAAALVISEGHVLCADHHRDGIWAPPGGGVDQGETSAEAAVRELVEETGLAGAASRLVFVVENKFSVKGARLEEVGFYHLVAVKAALWEGMRIGSEPHLRLRWLRLARIGGEDLRPAVLKPHLDPLPGSPLHLINID
ncbi:MAG: NUDIX domain-containing protein [Pseudomonadota bacterium]